MRYPARNCCDKTLKRKFTYLYTKKIPIGDPNMPPHERCINVALRKQSDLGGVESSGISGNENNGANNVATSGADDRGGNGDDNNEDDCNYGDDGDVAKRHWQPSV